MMTLRLVPVASFFCRVAVEMVEFDKNKNYKPLKRTIGTYKSTHKPITQKTRENKLNSRHSKERRQEEQNLMINLRNFICSTGKNKRHTQRIWRRE